MSEEKEKREKNIQDKRKEKLGRKEIYICNGKMCGRNENAEGKKGKREYFRHSGDFIHAQNRF